MPGTKKTLRGTTTEQIIRALLIKCAEYKRDFERNLPLYRAIYSEAQLAECKRLIKKDDELRDTINQSYLWKVGVNHNGVEDEDASQSLYVYGTIHGKVSEFVVDATLFATMNEVDVYITELEFDGRDLRNYNDHLLHDAGPAHIFDLDIYSYARASGRSVRGMETKSERAAWLSESGSFGPAYSPKIHTENHGISTHNIGVDNRYEERRNENFVRKIVEQLATGERAVVFVGAYHLHYIITHLRLRGYSVVPVF